MLPQSLLPKSRCVLGQVGSCRERCCGAVVLVTSSWSSFWLVEAASVYLHAKRATYASG